VDEKGRNINRERELEGKDKKGIGGRRKSSKSSRRVKESKSENTGG